VANIELILGLLVAIAVLAGFARVVGIPYPVVLVLGGLAIGLVPGFPHVRVQPDLIFFVFLPPLLYSAAFLSSATELRELVRPILTLAIGLVLATMVVTAVVAHGVFGVPWAPAFVLGAVVGATDPISATSLLRRLGAPERIAALLEGESLVNDGTALVSYKLAIAAAAAASFSLPVAVLRFVAVSLGGAAIGLAVGWISARIRRSFDDAPIEITVSLLTPFAAYIPADRVGVSGVLAAVAAGLYVGGQSTWIFSAETRLRYYAFWEVLAFLLNSLLFLLIGLQIRSVLDALQSIRPLSLLGDAALLSAVVVALRFAWMFLLAPVDDALPGAPVARSWRERVVVGWSGMRGGLSLAAVLAIPLTANGAPFPERNLLLFLTFAVILVTLVLPGLTLAPLIRMLLGSDREASERQALEARIALAQAALARLDELDGGSAAPPEVLEQLRAEYDQRLGRLEAELHGTRMEPFTGDTYPRLRRDLLSAQRLALSEMRRHAHAPDSVLRAIERDLDLEEARLRRSSAAR
jgi:Na+/H+ antiporter